MSNLFLCVRPFCFFPPTARLFSTRGVETIRLTVTSSSSLLSCVCVISKTTTTNVAFSVPLGINPIASTISKRNFRATSNTQNNHNVNESGYIDSPLINSMKSKIKEQLNAESVIVKDAYGDGRHVSIDVVSSVFEGESAVSRQRMVYKAIWEELQNTVHAVDQMTTKTPSEAATNK